MAAFSLIYGWSAHNCSFRLPSPTRPGAVIANYRGSETSRFWGQVRIPFGLFSYPPGLPKANYPIITNRLPCDNGGAQTWAFRSGFFCSRSHLLNDGGHQEQPPQSLAMNGSMAESAIDTTAMRAYRAVGPENALEDLARVIVVLKVRSRRNGSGQRQTTSPSFQVDARYAASGQRLGQIVIQAGNQAISSRHRCPVKRSLPAN